VRLALLQTWAHWKNRLRAARRRSPARLFHTPKWDILHKDPTTLAKCDIIDVVVFERDPAQNSFRGTMSSQVDIYGLVEEFCSGEQVTTLLRAAKGSKGVRISAENKHDLVHRNLREAIEARSLPIERVFNLLRDAEENGDQHVFYFKARSRRLGDFDSIGKALFGSRWPDKTGFPKVDLIPRGFLVSDFRGWNEKKPKDWALKVYGHEIREHFTGVKREEGSAIWKRFEQQEFRHVLLARWNSPDLLEMRVPRDDSKRRLNDWLGVLWNELNPAISQTNFQPWDLSRARRRLIEEEDKNTTLYRFHDTQLEDSNHSRASFEPYTEQLTLFTAIETKDAIQGLLRAKSECTRLAVTWLEGRNGIPAKDLRTLIGVGETNEVVIARRCSQKELDFVTEQLRDFSK
jgi:hypothetical protein